ncbi:MAG: hypothetical protein K0Q69_1177 [Devosia sp.]|jgi:hypothetical protein|nr:hypothetical protein [Devosia sp.]
MKQRIATLEAAADVLAREIEAEINRASRIVRERVKPEFDRRLRALALAVVETQRASADLSALEDELDKQGVRGVSSMSPLDTRLLGSPRDPHGSANIWLRGAVKEGVLKDRELPEGARL